MIVDTTVLIDFLRGKENAIGVLQKATESYPLITTEINIFELVTGAYLLGKNPHLQLENVFSMLSKMMVLPLDRRASLKAGEIAGNLIREGKKIDETDCLIAGIAIVNGISGIITKNKEHFKRIPQLKVVDY